MLAILSQWKLIALGLLITLLSVQTVRLEHAYTEAGRLRLEHAEATRKAEHAAREEEKRRQEIVDNETTLAQNRISSLETELAGAISARDGLRAAVSSAVSRTRSNPKPASGGARKPDSDPNSLFAKLYLEADERAGEVSVYADRLRSAGLACEAIYDGLGR